MENSSNLAAETRTHPRSLNICPYSVQSKEWPVLGKHFMAHQPAEGIITLYQAYKPTIANCAVEHQRLDASSDFKTTRMTWAKPGFLWMMYRSGWASKHNQECILAIHVRASWLFSILLRHAKISTVGKTRSGKVVVQWDPDHAWNGSKQRRRAIQIGMRGSVAQEFAAGIAGPAVSLRRGSMKLEELMKLEMLTPYCRAGGVHRGHHAVCGADARQRRGGRSQGRRAAPAHSAGAGNLLESPIRASLRIFVEIDVP